MSKDRWTIGELSRRTGVAVKTLRYYSDEGIIAPVGRSRGGYRQYDEGSVARVELVRALRDADLGLDAIARVVRRDMPLREALRMRLAAVEAHAASLRLVAAALRAALREGDPSEDDLRRLTTVTRLSNEERRAMIERFYQRLSEGIPIDQGWMKSMIEASAPRLPDDPTKAQLDAWIELSELVADDAFVEALRANARDVWRKGFDMGAMQRTNGEVEAAATEALARGVAPTADEARPAVDRYVEGLAAAAGHGPSDAVRRGIRERFARQDPRASRYWELVATIHGGPPVASKVDAWRWVAAAVAHHLA